MAVITPKELAQDLGTDAKTLRKFLRSITPVEDRPGKGSRWAIEKRQVKSLKTKFNAWVAANEAKKATAEVEDATDEVDEG